MRPPNRGRTADLHLQETGWWCWACRLPTRPGVNLHPGCPENLAQLLDTLDDLDVSFGLDGDGNVYRQGPPEVLAALEPALGEHRDLLHARLVGAATGSVLAFCDQCGEPTVTAAVMPDGKARDTWPRCRRSPTCGGRDQHGAIGRHRPRPRDLEARDGGPRPPAAPKPPPKSPTSRLLGPRPPWPGDPLTGADRAPHRIQLRRTKGWRKPEGAIVVARPTRWGNPWSVADAIADGYVDNPPGAVAAICVERYRNWLAHPEADVRARRIVDALAELGGRDLACWCPLGQPCHADVLLRFAASEEVRRCDLDR
ncbi:hypothetical protein BH23ACT2_BH23ACT2_01590 [soil metagenome]